ncbi:hypothetical protein, partial [Escherichia coli]|uniref:hypothetical protein n=1 Tax=Escherichia coli TaxID=562 RepID=UPI00259D3007
QPSGKNIIRWLLKKRTNGSVRYCQYTSILAKIWRPDSPPLRSRSRQLTLFNAVRKALSDNPSGLTLPIKKPKKTERIVTIVLPI